MSRLLAGSFVAALAMFVLAYVFYGTSLMQLGWAVASPDAQAVIQSALKSLPATGTYAIPYGETPAAMAAYAAGPVAQIQFNSRGFPLLDPVIFAGDYLHMVVSILLLGCVLLTASIPDFGRRARLAIGIAAVAVVYLHLAGPIWYHTDWRNALYVTVADFVTLSAGGLILARWFVRPR